MCSHIAGTSTATEIGSDAPSTLLLRRRELGGRNFSFSTWRRPIEEQRLSTLKIVGHIPINFSARAGVTALDIDRNDNDFLLAGSARGSIDVVNLCYAKEIKREPAIPKKYQHSKMINACQWLPSGIEMFATASQDGTVKTWDLDKQKPFDTYEIENPKQMHWNEVDSRNPLIAVGNESSNVVLIDLRKGSCDHNVRNKTTVTALRWMPTERVLCTGDSHGTLKYWDVRKTSAPLQKLKIKPSSQIAAIRFTSDGRFLICVDSCELDIFVLDAITLKKIHTASAAYSQVRRIHPNTRNVCLAEDGTHLRVGVPSTEEKLAWIWFDMLNPDSPPFRQFLAGHMLSVSSCAYRPSHQQLLTSSDGMIINWSSEGERARVVLKSEGRRENQRSLHQDEWSDED